MNNMNDAERMRGLVLIVDDDEDFIEFITHVLEDDYHVDAVTSGEAAFDYFTTRVPDLVLLDIMLPRIDGFTFCAMLKKNPPTSALPVIFLTARRNEKDIIRGFRLGAVDYIIKPCCPEELMRRVQTHIDLKKKSEYIEESVEIQKHELEYIFNCIDDLIYVSELETDTILFANKKLKEVFQVDNPEGKNCYEVLQSKPDPCDLRNKGVLEHNETDSCRWEYYNRLVKRHFEVVDKLVRWPDGRTVKIQVAYDVTEKKKSQRILQKAKANAEKANRAKSDFLANMSHELRTPMSSIIGISRMLADSAEGMEEHQKEGLELIHKSSKRLLELIDDILDLSRLEAGKLDVVSEPCAISDIVKQLNHLMLPLLSGKEIEFCINKDDRVPNIVYTDSRKVIQILINLLGNSIKFTVKGHIKLDIFVDDEKLCFKVTDTGTGIEKEFLELVFEKFNRGQVSNTQKVKGTGIGLSLSKKMTQLLGGEISISSEKGRGTVVDFYIPLILHE